MAPHWHPDVGGKRKQELEMTLSSNSVSACSHGVWDPSQLKPGGEADRMESQGEGEDLNRRWPPLPQTQEGRWSRYTGGE